MGRWVGRLLRSSRSAGFPGSGDSRCSQGSSGTHWPQQSGLPGKVVNETFPVVFFFIVFYFLPPRLVLFQGLAGLVELAEIFVAVMFTIHIIL